MLWWGRAKTETQCVQNTIKTFEVEFANGFVLNYWCRVTHICVSKIITIGSDIGLSPGRRQAIIWTTAGILLNGPLGINFSEILIEIYTFSLKNNSVENVFWEMVAILSRPECVNVILILTTTRWLNQADQKLPTFSHDQLASRYVFELCWYQPQHLHCLHQSLCCNDKKTDNNKYK